MEQKVKYFKHNVLQILWMNYTVHTSFMFAFSRVPRPKEEEKKGPSFSRSCIHLYDYPTC